MSQDTPRPTDSQSIAAAENSAAAVVSGWETPPTTFFGVLRRLGPGLIVAASIVGSGELIATTKTGAEAGFALLWLIILGCVIKVFVQVEFGRYSISEGKTAMDIMNRVPGPRLGASWLVWYWVIVFSATIAQLGGIAGLVGQAMAITFPITGDFLEAINAGRGLADGYTWDDVYWTVLIAIATSALLANGRYGLIQTLSTVLVAGFTLVTVFNVFSLPVAVPGVFTFSDFVYGLSFQLPPVEPGLKSPLLMALATFGIIGVGAGEIIVYPYWCLEKGYARFTGPREQSSAWAQRARGWLRVMRIDVWCSMVVYTLATVAFYVLGAAVLFPKNLRPDENQLIVFLAEMYRDVFGIWGEYVFLIGAIAVLYSTFFVAIAGNIRVAVDGLGVLGVVSREPGKQHWWVRRLCAVFPIICLIIYTLYKKPVTLVMIAGLSQAVMLPMLGGTALWFRYRLCDRRLLPGRVWDICLWLSMVGFCIVAAVAVYDLLTRVPPSPPAVEPTQAAVVAIYKQLFV